MIFRILIYLFSFNQQGLIGFYTPIGEAFVMYSYKLGTYKDNINSLNWKIGGNHLKELPRIIGFYLHRINMLFYIN